MSLALLSDPGALRGSILQSFVGSSPCLAGENRKSEEIEEIDVIVEAMDEVEPEGKEMEEGADTEAESAEGPGAAPVTSEETKKAQAPQGEVGKQFNEMSIKELKSFLRQRAVRVPASVNEKQGLIELVEESKDLPALSEEELLCKELKEAADRAAKKEQEAPEKPKDPEPEKRKKRSPSPVKPACGWPNAGFCGPQAPQMGPHAVPPVWWPPFQVPRADFFRPPGTFHTGASCASYSQLPPPWPPQTPQHAATLGADKS